MADYYEKYWKEKSSDTLDDYHYKWPKIKNLIPNKKNFLILDFGSGTGKITSKMKEIAPKSEFIGVDISKEAIRRAKKKSKEIKFLHIKNHTRLPFKDSYFDFIVMADVIEHIIETKETLDELNRVLKKGGKILITTPYHGTIKNLIISLMGFETVFDPSGPHIRFFTPQSLKCLLKKTGFKDYEIGYFGRFFPLWRGFYVVASKK